MASKRRSRSPTNREMIATALKYARDCAARVEMSDARLEAIEKQLHVNFQRIAQLQLELDRLKKART